MEIILSEKKTKRKKSDVIHTNQPLTLVRNNPNTNIICYETIKNLIHDKIDFEFYDLLKKDNFIIEEDEEFIEIKEEDLRILNFSMIIQEIIM
jgi:hypothetical protein